MSGCLSQELIDRSREQFQKYEEGSEQTGKINVWDVGDILENMNGEKVLDEVLLQMISEVDRNLSGYIDFFQLLTLVETYERWRERTSDAEGNDLLTAYIACGGGPDKGGCVNASTLIKIVKEDFGLTVDIERLIALVDSDGSGEIEFDEFMQLLS